jgi:ketosteroid isomerase-like protein
MNYDATAKDIRAFFGATRMNRLTLDTLYIRVLSPDVVAAFTPFHQVITDTTGATAQFKGDALWIARRTDGQWKICYSQSNHLRDEALAE